MKDEQKLGQLFSTYEAMTQNERTEEARKLIARNKDISDEFNKNANCINYLKLLGIDNHETKNL